jgi:hypothetical protein
VTTTEAPPRVLQVLDRDGHGLQVTWYRDEDRYGHVIAYVAGARATACLTSDLGRERDPWPASPPLQQCSLEPSTRGRQMGLAVGMAGKSHWSQSVETDPVVPGLVFDLACRVHHQPLWLGSSYRAAHALEALSESRVRLTVAAGVDLILSRESPDGASPVRLEVSGNHLALTADLGKLPLPSTVRWRYRVALAVRPARADDEAD